MRESDVHISLLLCTSRTIFPSVLFEQHISSLWKLVAALESGRTLAMPVLYGRQNATAGMMPPDPAYCAESNLHEIMGVASAMNASSTAVMLLRVLVRVFMTKSFGSDDYCMLVAWLMQLATFICWLGERPYANGKHYACITPRDFEMHGKWQYCHSLVVMCGVVLVKISIALFLMRLVPPGKRWKSFLWASIGMHFVCWAELG